MLPIRGLYEVAIRVKSLEKSEAFYRETLGLEVGYRDEGRHWLFLTVAGKSAMLVLQEDRVPWPLQHFAFRVDEADLRPAVAALQERGVHVQGPVHHAWMAASSVYFFDPDGHELELCAHLSK